MSVPIFEFRASDVRTAPRPSYNRIGKRVLDLSILVLAAPIVIPVVAILALVTALGGGAPFYAQRRIGAGGEEFNCWKIRTMVRDADDALPKLLAADPALAEEWDRTQKLARDPRITRVGALLRKTSLDEIPQLWNVLTGSMSLVGPRPFTPEQAVLYRGGRADAEYYRMRPGLTGLWQVSRRNRGSFAERTIYDGQYWAKMSLGTDLGILVRTVGVVLKGTGV